MIRKSSSSSRESEGVYRVHALLSKGQSQSIDKVLCFIILYIILYVSQTQERTAAGRTTAAAESSREQQSERVIFFVVLNHFKRSRDYREHAQAQQRERERNNLAF